MSHCANFRNSRFSRLVLPEHLPHRIPHYLCYLLYCVTIHEVQLKYQSFLLVLYVRQHFLRRTYCLYQLFLEQRYFLVILLKILIMLFVAIPEPELSNSAPCFVCVQQPLCVPYLFQFCYYFSHCSSPYQSFSSAS